jgi:hypothetical protein
MRSVFFHHAIELKQSGTQDSTENSQEGKSSSQDTQKDHQDIDDPCSRTRNQVLFIQLSLLFSVISSGV